MSDNNKNPKAAAPLAPDAGIAPSGFFAFRTPLLPYEELEGWSAGLAAETAQDEPEQLEKALAADRELLRERLRDMAARPEVLEAIFLASPSLTDGLEIWRTAPDSKKGQRAERALVRYLYRMVARATPFGLFSGCSIGPLDATPGSATRLQVGPRTGYERHTRLDMDYLFALCEDLAKDPALRGELLFRPNSSLYRAAGRLRYAEARVEEKVRSHHLVAVEATSYLEETLERAKGGARAHDLAAALAADDPEVTHEEAAEFIGELIDSQVLVSELSPPVTGPESIHDVIAQLEELAAGKLAAERLVEARDLLAALDRGGPGAEPERYREIAARLGDLPTSVEINRLFQLDMVKPAVEPVLGAAVVEEMSRSVTLLRRMIAKTGDPFERFRKDFSERYGDGREVPLIEVLDEEIGIGFERSGGAGAEASPLLRGLALPSPAADPTVPWGPKQAFLFSRLTRALTTGETEIALTAEEVERIAPPPAAGTPEAPPLPDGFQIMVTVAAPSAEALANGDFQVLFNNASGPSGARLLGRFCHADPALTREVEAHLRAEEALRPEAVFVEIVHLPQGRIGNILSRPVLRDYELAYLGRSGAALDHQLPITDLMVSVAGSRVVLRSARLGREVIPRLTSAHNFSTRSLGVYRFLCTLQAQGVIGGLGWMWGALDGAPFLPRVTHGRIVLHRASWWMTGDEIKTIKAAVGGTARFAAVREWRKKRQLPRLLVLADGDNELLIDLENVLSVETFVDVVEDRDRARLHEVFPGPDQLPATGPEGRFVHEILVPFVRVAAEPKAPPSEAPAAPKPAITARPTLRRSFPPGSEWLYAKLYTGTSTADGMLHEVIAPVVEATRDASDSWFFIRYGDPAWHLRVRFHGDPTALQTRVMPALAAAAAPLLEDGRLWKMQLDTYEREIERYGGPRGMELGESLFRVDSDAVLEVLEMLDGDEGADARWRLALYGTDMLLSDLGLDAAAKVSVMGGMRNSFAQEFAGGSDVKSIRIQLDHRLRSERKGLDTLLYASGDEHPLAPGLAVFKKRSERLAPIVAELSARQTAGELTSSLAQMAPSYVHMHVNRMIRSAGRAHELVMYDFLYQLYQSRAAREQKRANPREGVKSA